MAVQVYRKGNTHTVRGVECELRNIDVKYLETFLKSGEWVSDPSQLVRKKPGPKKKVDDSAAKD